MIDPALVAATDAAIAARPNRRTVLVRHEGAEYIAKRLAKRPRRILQIMIMRWLVRQVLGQTLPLRTLALTEATESMDYEANRLASLQKAGASVPNIVGRTDAYLLLEHCGETVDAAIRDWSPEKKQAELLALAAELAEFHARGLWHGGAQIKNLTVRNGRYTRIDFEEDFGEFLPLPTTHACDLIVFLNSVSLAPSIDEAESRKLLPQLLKRYFSVHVDHGRQMHYAMQSFYPWLARAAWLARPFRSPSRKGPLRLIILSDVVGDYLQSHADARPA